MRPNCEQRFSLALAVFMLLGCVPLYGIQAKVPTQDLRTRAWDMLWKGAHSSDPGKRSAAIHALGLLHASPEVVRLAEDALRDKDPEVREEAATALGEMHASSAIPLLKKSLSDSDVAVALAAARSLVLLNSKAGYDFYYAVLTGKQKSGQSLLAQQLDQFDSTKKVAEFAFDQGIGFLPYAGYGMEVIQALTAKDNSPVRAAAARVLEKDPDPRSGKALAEACSDKDWIVQMAALKAVAMRGNPALLPAVKAEMTGNNAMVEYTAAAAAFRLASIGSVREQA